MKLDDLTRDEQMVLGGLLRLMLRSDGQFSEGEEAALDRIGQRIAGSAERMWKVISDSAQLLPEDDDIRAAVGNVERDEARREIRWILEELAVGDAISESEQALLSWLRERWS
jgi:hypothetical protein